MVLHGVLVVAARKVHGSVERRDELVNPVLGAGLGPTHGEPGRDLEPAGRAVLPKHGTTVLVCASNAATRELGLRPVLMTSTFIPVLERQQLALCEAPQQLQTNAFLERTTLRSPVRGRRLRASCPLAARCAPPTPATCRRIERKK